MSDKETKPQKGLLGKLMGSLTATPEAKQTVPGKIASRGEYLKYVEAQAEAGKPALPFEQWAKQ